MCIGLVPPWFLPAMFCGVKLGLYGDSSLRLWLSVPLNLISLKESLDGHFRVAPVALGEMSLLPKVWGYVVSCQCSSPFWGQISQHLAGLLHSLWFKIAVIYLFHRQLKYCLHFLFFLRFLRKGRERINVYTPWSLTKTHFVLFQLHLANLRYRVQERA